MTNAQHPSREIDAKGRTQFIEESGLQFRPHAGFGKADLDAIYRLFGLKRAEVEAFLDKQLPAEVDRAFETAAGAERDALQNRLEDLADFRDYAFTVPTVSGKYRVRFKLIEATAPKDNTKGDTRLFFPLPKDAIFEEDTRHFSPSFNARLLDSIDDVDEQTDGLLIHGENFQAISLMQARYREQVKIIYIDPPYNTGTDDFIYKDRYQHSSWLSMVTERISLGTSLLHPEGLYLISCDDHEVERLRSVLSSFDGLGGFSQTLVWKSRNFTDTRPLTGVSLDHEYIIARGAGPVSASAVRRRISRSMRIPTTTLAARGQAAVCSGRPRSLSGLTSLHL